MSHQTPTRTLWLVADQTSASIDVAARPDEIMAVIADFEHYPDWVDSMKSAEVLSFVDGNAKTVRMVLDHTLLKDDYVWRTSGSHRPSVGRSSREICSGPWRADTS